MLAGLLFKRASGKMGLCRLILSCRASPLKRLKAITLSLVMAFFEERKNLKPHSFLCRKKGFRFPMCYAVWGEERSTRAFFLNVFCSN